MKKMLLSVTLLLMLVSITNAADKKQTAVTNTFDTKTTDAVALTSAAVANYAAVLEENTKLRVQAAELTSKIDEYESKLGYSRMMHVTISNLQDLYLDNTMEDVYNQVNYARTMNAVLVNLATVVSNLK